MFSLAYRWFYSADGSCFVLFVDYPQPSCRGIFCRPDVSFGLEHHSIRGIDKRHCQMVIALIVMLAMARGRLRQKQRDAMRSLMVTALPPHEQRAA